MSNADSKLYAECAAGGESQGDIVINIGEHTLLRLKLNTPKEDSRKEA